MKKKVSDQIYIYPTDTVWGIGCSIYSSRGHERIAEIKKTTKDKPLSIMFSSIAEVLKSFQLPERLTTEWLAHFFKLQTTLGLPLKTARINIPQWAFGESEYVSLRCLETEVVKKIHDEIQAPFFTTSLNLSGSLPITDFNEAIEFQKKYANDALLISLKESETNALSGASSSIVFLNEDLSFKILREGKCIEEVRSHLQKLSGK